MPEASPRFTRVDIAPIACLQQSWELLRPQYWMFFAITLVGVLIANAVPFGILAGPMICGIFGAWFKVMEGRTIAFEMLFEGFDLFIESLIATLIVVVITLLVVAPAGLGAMLLLFIGMAAGEQGGDPVIGMVAVAGTLLLGLLGTVVMLAVAILTVFVYPLIVDRGLKAVPAIRLSLAAGWAHFGGLLALLLMIGALSVVAVLACYIPLFFLAPWSFGAIGVAYRRVFPLAAGSAP